MRYLGIDYGSARIGLAISDEQGSFAFPEKVLANDAGVYEAIAKLVAEKGVKAIIIGDTRSLDGSPNRITEEADAFVEQLKKKVPVLLARVREAWSSQEAARFAPKGKTHDDSAAAAILLQRFLDARPPTG